MCLWLHAHWPWRITRAVSIWWRWIDTRHFGRKLLPNASVNHPAPLEAQVFIPIFVHSVVDCSFDGYSPIYMEITFLLLDISKYHSWGSMQLLLTSATLPWLTAKLGAPWCSLTLKCSQTLWSSHKPPTAAALRNLSEQSTPYSPSVASVAQAQQTKPSVQAASIKLHSCGEIRQGSLSDSIQWEKTSSQQIHALVVLCPTETVLLKAMTTGLWVSYGTDCGSCKNC